MRIGNKISKFLIHVLLILAFTYNCLATNDCRHVSNDKLVSDIKTFHNVGLIQREYFSTKDMVTCNVQFKNMIFILDHNCIGRVFIVVPVYSSVRKYVGEVITPLTVESVDSVETLLDMMTLNSGTCPTFTLGKSYYKHYFVPRKNLVRYTSTANMESFLRQTVGEGYSINKFFYAMPQGCNWKNSTDYLDLLCDGIEDDVVIRRKIRFQNSSGTDFADMPLSVDKGSGFFENLVEAVRGYFLKQEGYARVLTDDSRDAKLKSE